MENNDKKTTFPDFMSRYHILIPIIQRDYAQGRRNAPKSMDVRASFIPALKNAVCNQKELSLDFIYGLKDGNNKLLLLDGQQRITTLLLFAWYCQKHSQEWHFNYAARSVDDEFITQLLKTKFDYSSLPSEFVMKQNWYFASWQDDPTVSGMSCMLDEIHKHLEGTDASTADFSKISFYIHVLCSATTMAEYNKIFLKMNARGKALDDWENAKAILDKNVPKDLKDMWSEKINYSQEELWKISSDDNLDAHIKTTNEIMHRIVKTVLRRCYRQKGKDGYDLLNYELDEWLSDNNDKKEFYMLCQRYFAEACSSKFKHYWITLRSEHPLWNEDAKEMEKDYFFDIMKDRISYANSLKYAFLVECFGNQKIQPRKMRILLNLLDNTNVNKENFYELCDNGLAFLRGEKEISDLGFNQTQTEDENRKQSWVENDVKTLECDPLIWQGSCSFLYYNNNEEYTIDNIKNNLSGIRKLIKQNWKSYFCNILSQIPYNNKWWEIPEKVRIPVQNESLWAEYIFANHKVNMREWLQKLLTSGPQIYPAWLEYFNGNILKEYNEKYNNLKYIKFTQGWNYCISGNNVTDDSVRLPWNECEAKNLEKLKEHPVKRKMHRDSYCESHDGSCYYKIDDESWWEGENPKQFKKNVSGQWEEIG